jgi:hypothetical protein
VNASRWGAWKFAITILKNTRHSHYIYLIGNVLQRARVQLPLFDLQCAVFGQARSKI